MDNTQELEIEALQKQIHTLETQCAEYLLEKERIWLKYDYLLNILNTISKSPFAILLSFFEICPIDVDKNFEPVGYSCCTVDCVGKLECWRKYIEENIEKHPQIF